ncbi:hypothetical protein DMENIID0001_052500 [Sergentomyia squamirostris]
MFPFLQSRLKCLPYRTEQATAHHGENLISSETLNVLAPTYRTSSSITEYRHQQNRNYQTYKDSFLPWEKKNQLELLVPQEELGSINPWELIVPKSEERNCIQEVDYLNTQKNLNQTSLSSVTTDMVISSDVKPGHQIFSVLSLGNIGELLNTPITVLIIKPFLSEIQFCDLKSNGDLLSYTSTAEVH